MTNIKFYRTYIQLFNFFREKINKKTRHIHHCLTVLLLLSSQLTVALEAADKVCGLSVQSKQLAQIIINAHGQHRTALHCNDKLAKAAAEKAKQMAQADLIEHTINHVTANENLNNFGIKLPESYEILGNQVEAVAGGKKSPQAAYDYFMTSPDHKAHILGENSFYQAQDQIGVGFYYDESKNFEQYWVVYITSLKNESEPINRHYKFKFVFDKKPKKERFKRGDTVRRDRFW